MSLFFWKYRFILVPALLFLFISVGKNVWAKSTLAEAIARAQDEQLNFQDKKAIQTLNAALADFNRSTPDLENLSKLADAYLFLAFCHKNLGETQQMDENLDEAARLNPSLIPSDLLFPPSLAAQFEQAKDRIWGRENFSSLLIESRPAGARIFVNGAFKGMAPLRLDRYPGGLHYIYALKEEKKAFRKVNLTTGATARIKLKLKGSK